MTLHGDSQTGTLTRAFLQKYLVLVDINVEDRNGFIPLALSVKNDHPSVIKLLLKSGATADKPVRDGRTPLYLAANAKQNRPRIVQLLLGQNHKPDGRDPELVRLLVDAGASLTKTNDRGETAVSLADQTTNTAIKDALVPKAQRSSIGSALAQLLVSALMFALAYAEKWPGVKEIMQNTIRSVSDQANPTPAGSKSAPGTDIEDPQTVEEVKHNIGNIIQDSGLDDFFAPGDLHVQEIAEKATALTKDQANPLSSKFMIMKLAHVALYHPVLYIDDSGSMAEGNRMSRAKALVMLMTEVATTLVGDNKGIHLRFINKDDSTANNLRAPGVEQRMSFTPEGWTEIGMNLKKKILQPMVYDVINRDVLQRPVSVLTITDGVPSKENSNEFGKAIVESKKELKAKYYQKQAVLFDLSQGGNDPEAVAFIESFEGDSATSDVLHRTAEHTDALFEELREAGKEDELKKWLAAPITFKA